MDNETSIRVNAMFRIDLSIPNLSNKKNVRPIPAITAMATISPFNTGIATTDNNARVPPNRSRPIPNDLIESPKSSILLGSAPIISKILNTPAIPTKITVVANRPTRAGIANRATRANEPANLSIDIPTSPSNTNFFIRSSSKPSVAYIRPFNISIIAGTQTIEATAETRSSGVAKIIYPANFKMESPTSPKTTRPFVNASIFSASSFPGPAFSNASTIKPKPRPIGLRVGATSFKTIASCKPPLPEAVRSSRFSNAVTIRSIRSNSSPPGFNATAVCSVLSLISSRRPVCPPSLSKALCRNLKFTRLLLSIF